MNVTTCPTPPQPTPPMCTKTHGQIKTVLQLSTHAFNSDQLGWNEPNARLTLDDSKRNKKLSDSNSPRWTSDCLTWLSKYYRKGLIDTDVCFHLVCINLPYLKWWFSRTTSNNQRESRGIHGQPSPKLGSHPSKVFPAANRLWQTENVRNWSLIKLFWAVHKNLSPNRDP